MPIWGGVLLMVMGIALGYLIGYIKNTVIIKEIGNLVLPENYLENGEPFYVTMNEESIDILDKSDYVTFKVVSQKSQPR